MGHVERCGRRGSDVLHYEHKLCYDAYCVRSACCELCTYACAYTVALTRMRLRGTIIALAVQT